MGDVLAVSEPIDAEMALDLGLVTFAPDDLDWDDEIRLVVEERASYSPDALRNGSLAAVCRARNHGDEDFWTTECLAELDFPTTQCGRRPGALSLYGRPERAVFDWRRT